MDWNEIVITLIGTVLAPLVGWAIKQLGSWAKAQAKGRHAETAKTLIERAESAVLSAVHKVEQTTVKSIKEEDNWAFDTQDSVKSEAIALAKKLVAPQNLKDLATLYEGDNAVEELLDSLVEAAVFKSKPAAPPVS